MWKYDLEVMLVENKKLFKTKHFQWFKSKDDVDLEEKILENYEFMVRKEAEVNYDYKQPIPYGIVVHSETKKVFVYKRSFGENNGEKRLDNNISWWVWGHIEKEHDKTDNPLKFNLQREIREELWLTSIKNTNLLGFINDETNDVWKVHLWVLYVVETDIKDMVFEDWEISNGEFLDVNDLEEMIKSWEYHIENWSLICFDELKKYISDME